MSSKLQIVLVLATLAGVLAETARAATYLSMPAALRYGYAVDADEPLEASVRLVPELEALTDQWRFKVSGRLEGDAEDLLEPGRPTFDTYTSMSRPRQLGDWGRLELRDAYLEAPFGRNLVRVGKQQIVWGNLDGIKVLDVLNPQRFREFILEPFAASRIGTWSAYFDLLLGDWRAELAFIPDVTTHEIPQPGAWFELTAPRFRYGAAPGDPVPPQSLQRPTVSDGTSALRLSRRVAGVDLGLVALTGLDHEPLGRIVLDGGSPSLQQFYERRALYGLQAETALAGLVLRLEASYQPERTFNTRQDAWLDTTRLDQWRVAAALDIDAPFGIFVNLQYLHDQVLKAPDELVRPAIDRVVTAFARRRFFSETLLLELRWYGELEQDDGMARAVLEYQLGGNTRLRLAGDHFYGPQSGLFGQFEARDRVTLAIEHTF